MRRLIVALLLFSVIFNFVTFSLVLLSDFWNTPVSAQASADGNVALIVTSAPSNNTGGDGGTGGGGGGGSSGGGSSNPATSTSAEASFTIDKEELNIFVVSGDSDKRTVVLKNTGDTPLDFTISVGSLSSFVIVDKSVVHLGPGESTNITISIKAPDGGIYGGRITFRTGETRKDVIVLLNVRSANALFDTSLTIPDSYKILPVGRILKTFISLLQVGPAESTDVTVHYMIKDFEGNTLFTETETFRVFRNKDYVKEFKTQELAPGDYLAGIEVVYPEGFATSSSHFTIVAYTLDYWFVGLIVLLILSLLVLYYSFRNYRKAKELRDSIPRRNG